MSSPGGGGNSQDGLQGRPKVSTPALRKEIFLPRLETTKTRSSSRSNSFSKSFSRLASFGGSSPQTPDNYPGEGGDFRGSSPGSSRSRVSSAGGRGSLEATRPTAAENQMMIRFNNATRERGPPVIVGAVQPSYDTPVTTFHEAQAIVVPKAVAMNIIAVTNPMSDRRQEIGEAMRETVHKITRNKQEQKESIYEILRVTIVSPDLCRKFAGIRNMKLSEFVNTLHSCIMIEYQPWAIEAFLVYATNIDDLFQYDTVTKVVSHLDSGWLLSQECPVAGHERKLSFKKPEGAKKVVETLQKKEHMIFEKGKCPTYHEVHRSTLGSTINRVMSGGPSDVEREIFPVLGYYSNIGQFFEHNPQNETFHGLENGWKSRERDTEFPPLPREFYDHFLTRMRPSCVKVIDDIMITYKTQIREYMKFSPITENALYDFLGLGGDLELKETLVPIASRYKLHFFLRMWKAIHLSRCGFYIVPYKDGTVRLFEENDRAFPPGGYFSESLECHWEESPKD